MWGFGWSNKEKESEATEADEVDIDHSPANTDDEDPLPEHDSNGSEYSDEIHALQCNRSGILPSLTARAWGKWSEDDLAGIQLRGADYLSDRLKIDCGPPLFRLSHIDIFHVMNDEEKIMHVAQHDDAWLKTMAIRRDKLRKMSQNQSNDQSEEASESKQSNNHSASQSANIIPPPPYPKCRNCDPLMHHWHDHPLNPTIVINIVFPVKDIFMSLVQYYERRVPPADVLRQMIEGKKKFNQSNKQASNKSLEDDYDGPYCCSLLKDVELERIEAFDALLERFISDTDAFRDSTLKIIPRVSEGGWVVKKGVGRVPAILGKKVKQVYCSSKDFDWNGERKDRDSTNQADDRPKLNYLEIDADLATSRIAGQIVGLIKSYCKTIVVDMSFLLQGDASGVLPESLIGGIRIHKADMDKVPHWKETCEENKTLFPPY